MTDELPLYRVYLRLSSKQRLILVKEFDVTDLGKDLKAVLDELDRLKAENADLRAKLPQGEALSIDADDKAELARLREAASQAPHTFEIVLDNPEKQ